MYWFMPNQRGPDQKLVSFPASLAFINELDAAMESCGFTNRSEFIREAIIEKLARSGKAVPADLGKAPARFGKQKPKKTIVDSIDDGRGQGAKEAREGFIVDSVDNKNDQAGIDPNAQPLPEGCPNANEDPEILAEAHALLNHLVEQMVNKGKRKRRSRSRPSPHGTTSR